MLRHRQMLAQAFQRMLPQLLALVILLSYIIVPPATAAKQVGEYDIKAAFLFNLTYFVNWPEEILREKKQFIISIYGNDPFGTIIDKIVEGEQKYSKPLLVERINDLDKLNPKECQILFIDDSKMQDWPVIRQRFSGYPVLTVADTARFPEQGGMVNLLKSDQKIIVEINRSEVMDAGLSMSAKLLSLARLVQ